MIRPFAAAAALLALALSGAASAQTYGQPVYLNAWGGPVGGTPLSGVETRAHVATGRWADGYPDRPRVHVPAPGYGHSYGHSDGSYGAGLHDDGYGRDRGYGRYGHGRSDRPSRPGYRDEWGYNDDRPSSARHWPDERRSRRRDRDCGCGDVYLYDR